MRSVVFFFNRIGNILSSSSGSSFLQKHSEGLDAFSFIFLNSSILEKIKRRAVSKKIPFSKIQ